MPETHGSSPEEHDQSAGETLQRPGKKSEFARGLEHDLRTPLGVVWTSLDLLGAQIPPDDPRMEPVEMARRGLDSATSMLREAVNREPFPEHTLADVHEMLQTVLRTLCSRDYRCTLSVEGESACDDAKEDVMRISLATLPVDISRYNVRASQTGFERVLDNLIKNSIRKGAKNMRVAISKTGLHEISISVSDDGEGMKLKILKTLRQGEGESDKTEKDFIPGGTIKDHGHGISAVRQIMVDRCGGSMEIFSVKKSDLEDSDGEGQDSDSLKNHPFGSGATFRFRLPVTSMKLNGDHPPAPDQYPKNVRVLTRRRMIGLTAAALAGIAYVASENHESDEFEEDRLPSSPLTDAKIDDRGFLESCTFSIGGERITYEAGTRLPEGLRDVRTVPLNRGSLTVINPDAVEGRQLRRMFVCAFPEGIFAHVDAAFRGNRQMGFICAEKSSGETSMNLSHVPTHLLSDTILNTRMNPSTTGLPPADSRKVQSTFDATSIALLRSAAFDAMAKDLQAAAALLTRQTQHAQGASFNAVRPILLKLLNARHALKTRAIEVHDLAELQKLLEETDKFVVPMPHLVSQLRRVPLAVDHSAVARRNGSGVMCLQDVSPAEAQAMIRIG